MYLVYEATLAPPVYSMIADLIRLAEDEEGIFLGQQLALPSAQLLRGIIDGIDVDTRLATA